LAKLEPKRKNHHADQERGSHSHLDAVEGLHALADFGRSLNKAANLEKVSSLTLEHLSNRTSCDLALLLLMEGDDLTLQHALQSGRGADHKEDDCIEFGEWLGQRVISQDRSIYYPSDHASTSGLPAGCPETDIQSFAGLPLSSDGHDLGVLCLGWLESGGPESWRDYLEAAAGLVSAAFRKAHLNIQLEYRLAELAMNEERFRTAFMISPDAVNLTKLEGGALVEVNQAFLDMSGYSREEVLGRSTLDLDLWADPKDRERLTHGLMQDGKVENLTGQFRLKDGRIATGITAAKLIELRGEMYVLGFTRDITAQLAAEKALKESEENFRQLAENMGEVLWLRTTDDPPRFLYLSPAFDKVWGISRKLVYQDSKELLNTLISEDREGMVRGMRSIERTPEGQHHEFRIRRPDGSIRWMWSRRFPIFNKKGEVYRMAGLAQDVTERRLAEQALIESEGKLAAVINSVDEVMLMLDESLTIVWANDIAHRIFGQDLKGAKCYRICMERDRPCSQCMALQTLADGQPHEIETESISIQGKPIKLWGRATAVGRHSRDQPKSVVVVYRDVTRKKSLEAETMRAGRLASIGELAAGVAHEINNPVNGIINCAEMLAHGENSRLSPDELIDRIISEGERVATIVRSLLSFAHEDGETMGPVSLPTILESCLALIQAQLKKDGIILALDVPSDLPLVWGNSHQLQQVALNLIANSRYALNQKHPGIHPDKELAISAHPVRGEEDELIRLIFRDKGAGLSPEVLNKVFDPFFTTKPQGMGTGLGLSISHGIVKSHDGDLSLASLPGQYTEAVVELPILKRS
jgi:PAS domain S-box-containing protein